MEILQLYRKRIIPPECILLKDDVILEHNDEVLVTSWTTLNPKSAFSHGCSCYFLQEGFKVSKFLREDGSLLYWYCDIVAFTFDEEAHALTVTDLLADVIVYPDGRIRVMDLDELAQALERGLLTPGQMCLCLKQLHHLLDYIYRDRFDRLQARLP